MKGIGTDIVSLKRVREIRNLDRAAEFLFKAEEMDLYREANNKVQFFGSRLALKESVIKACPKALHYHDVVTNKTNNKIGIEKIDTYDIHVSISHEFDYALGFAVVL